MKKKHLKSPETELLESLNDETPVFKAFKLLYIQLLGMEALSIPMKAKATDLIIEIIAKGSRIKAKAMKKKLQKCHQDNLKSKRLSENDFRFETYLFFTLDQWEQEEAEASEDMISFAQTMQALDDEATKDGGWSISLSKASEIIKENQTKSVR